VPVLFLHMESQASFDEIRVFDGVAERTGTRLDRNGVRGRRSICRSLTDLAAKVRRLGDGYYYLSSSAWPEDQASVNLIKVWEPLG
jgi:hypothetical protein